MNYKMFLRADNIKYSDYFEYMGYAYFRLTDDTVALFRAGNAKGRVIIPEKVKDSDGRVYTVVRFLNTVMYEAVKEPTDKRVKDKHKWPKLCPYTNPFYNVVNPYVYSSTLLVEERCAVNKTMTSIVLPKTFNGILGGFYACHALEEVIVPQEAKVTEIDYRAFAGCKALKKIEIPDTITDIPACAFYGCSALKEVTIPSNVQTIDDKAFGDSGLEVVNILNDEGGIIIHPDAFPDSVKINYLGKKKIAKTSTKTETVNVSIDIETLIQAALADGVVTDKERAILIKKVREAGGDVDEFEMLLDARIYENQKKSQPKEVPVKTNDKKTQPQKIESGNSDFKKSASIKEYFIGILPDGKVVVKKNGEECENAMAALRAIAEAEGFALDPKWLTRQAGNNLVNFLNGKK